MVNDFVIYSCNSHNRVAQTHPQGGIQPSTATGISPNTLTGRCHSPSNAEPAKPPNHTKTPTWTVLVSLLFSYHSAVCLGYPHRLNAHAFPSAERPGTFVLHDLWGRQTQIFIIHLHRQNHPGLCHHDTMTKVCRMYITTSGLLRRLTNCFFWCTSPPPRNLS